LYFPAAHAAIELFCPVYPALPTQAWIDVLPSLNVTADVPQDMHDALPSIAANVPTGHG
jgi:hypothetical protein